MAFAAASAMPAFPELMADEITGPSMKDGGCSVAPLEFGFPQDKRTALGLSLRPGIFLGFWFGKPREGNNISLIQPFGLTEPSVPR